MSFAAINAVLAFAPPPPAGTETNPKAQLMQLLGMIFFMGVMLYFVVIMPQKKRAREQAALVEALKPGDKIVTNSGIVAVIVSVKERTVSVRSADTKLEILKSAISEITEKASASTPSS